MFFKKIKQKLDRLQKTSNFLSKDVEFIKTLLIKMNKENYNALFDTVYEVNMWGYGSGSGSLESVTLGYVEFLEKFFKTHKIQSIVDCGCGDWQFSKNIDFSSAGGGG